MDKDKTIAGIDYSMSSPAIFVDNTAYAFARKSWQGKHEQHDMRFVISDYPAYTSNEDRYHKLALWTMGILKYHAVDHVYLEGYSMGSNSGRTFDIAECGGHLKMTMHLMGQKFSLVPPTTLKKWFFGKGIAKKNQMHDAFVAETGFSLSETVFPNDAKKNIPAPITDIVDAYALYRYGTMQKTM